LAGPGGHTARPELTVDLVRWMGRLCDRLGATVHEATSGAALLVFGAALSGDAPNVIPATARLRGSLRTPERTTWESAERLVRTAIETVLGAGDAGSAPEWSLRYLRGMPPVINHPDTTALVREAVASLLGSAAIVPTQRSMGGDSFAWYADIVPGTYIRLGTHDPASPYGPRDLHSADFDVDERAIGIGAAVLAACAVRALAPAT
ncbi:MAG: M20/M25/M40 family metallo-hydrolase, partial [Actinomycetota bacterium]|nr:M20/M25/M40 family metallo-hydrolase [Actinomycetota bacterium]